MVVLKACVQLSDLKSGEEIRTHTSNIGYERDVFICSSLVNLYAKCRWMDEAIVVFEGMLRRDLVSWTTMITSFVTVGKPVDAIEVYRKIRLDWLEGDGIMMVGLVQSCAGVGDVRMGLSVHGRLVRFEMKISIVVETSVDMYAKNGMLERARIVFNRMHCKNVVTWSALISG